MTDQLLAALLVYGLPVLFGIILICSIGIPFPVSLMLVAAGSFIEQGEMKLWQVIAAASVAAVLGDQIGYGLARWGGRRLIKRISRKIGAADKIKEAEAFTKRWSGAGIFLSRWLVTPLGPWVNVTSGIAAYPWRRFLLWDALGQVLWVALYVILGYIFSNRVQAIVEILGNLAWVVVGLVVTVILGRKLVPMFARKT
ncbi:MAG TPA: DedA family protein [Blastocatellia bacterium]|nr:DedA family protein [Blastocatellia bacterium]HAF22938.1 DedA family protein [Blastocatellia bacterium]HCX31254.1 DedA family protein [Blastocatellia bacterium]